MALTTHIEPGDLFVMRMGGVFELAEFKEGQAALARAIDAGASPRILALLENFEGWEKGADWSEMDFQVSYGHRIRKIAVVGPERWEVEALAFAGAGFRETPIEFFPEAEIAAARAWLAE